MTLIASRKKRIVPPPSEDAPRWNAGDRISPLEAARLLGYKSAKIFHDPLDRLEFAERFKAATGNKLKIMREGRNMFLLRREIEDYLDKKLAEAENYGG